MNITDFTAGRCCWPLSDRFCCEPPVAGRSFCARHLEGAFTMNKDEQSTFDAALAGLLRLAGALPVGNA